MLRRSALLASLGLGLAACSLLTDLSGLREDGAPQEGGEPPADAAETDAADSAAPSDSSKPDGPPTPFCATGTHTFCADFDQGDPLAQWTRQETDPTGQLGLSITRARSPQRSLFALLPRRGAGAAKIPITLDKRFFGAWRRIVVDLDIYVERPDWKPGDVNAALLSIELYSDSASQGFYVASGEVYTNLQDVYGAPMPTDQWVHMKIDLDPAGTISGKIGSVSYTDKFPPLVAGGTPIMTVKAGINGYNLPAPRFAAYYDNVTVDLP